MFIRKKTIKGKDYYYLVESYREDRKVKQRVVKYLGAKKPSPEEVEKIKGGINK